MATGQWDDSTITWDEATATWDQGASSSGGTSVTVLSPSDSRIPGGSNRDIRWN